MKILCLIDTFRIGGGAQTQLAGLAVMLKKIGYDVEALSYYRIPPHLSFEPYLLKNGVTYHSLQATNMYRKLNVVNNAIQKYQPDVVIAYIDGATVISCLIKKIYNRNFRLIVSERNVTQKKTWREWVKFQLYRIADCIVPNAYAQERYIISNYPFLSSKIRTISNFVDSDRFIPPIDVRGNKRKLRILVVARVNPQKNVLGFMEALSLLRKEGREFTVDWYGRKSEHQTLCQKRIEELGLDEIFHFHDAVKDVHKIYSDCHYDVFCLPSFFEGCPNTLAEAMSCGLPVLCSNVCDNARYVEDDKNGYLFNPLLVEDMKNIIIRFAALSKERKCEMGEESRKRALNQLSKDAFLKKYLNLIVK